MAEINKIEIDGVEYTITAPKEKVNFLDLDYSCNIKTEFTDNNAYISFNQLYENKNIFFDYNELSIKMYNDNNPLPAPLDALIIEIHNLINCRIVIKINDVDHIKYININGFKLIHFIRNDSIDIYGLSNHYDDLDNNSCSYNIEDYNLVFICDIDEYGFCTLTPLTEGDI